MREKGRGKRGKRGMGTGERREEGKAVTSDGDREEK